MKRIILSGFRPFGDYPRNTTELVAQTLHGTSIPGFEIQAIVFDATIPEENRGVVLFQEAELLGGQAVISLGMASEKTGFCIERVARNRIANGKYCTAAQNNTPVDSQRRYNEEMFLGLEPWRLNDFRQSCKEMRIPVMPDSANAGGFCCNHLAYQARVAQVNSRAWNNIPYIFIHIPCSPEAVPDMKEFHRQGKITMSVEKIIEGIHALIFSADL